jgi:O-antigen/teichoic acid export membrane protein
VKHTMHLQNLLTKVFAAEFLAKGMLGVVSLLAIRLMNPDEFSLYSVVLSTLTFTTTFLSSAFNVVFIVRNFEGEHSLRTSFLFFQTLFAALIFLFFLPFHSIYKGLLGITFILVLSQIFLAFAQTYYQKRMDFVAFYKIEFFRVIVFLCCVLMLLFGEVELTALNVILCQIFSASIVFAFFSNGLFSLKLFFDYSKMNNVIRSIWDSNLRYLVSYFFIVTILFNCDIFLLTVFSNTNVVAEYAAGFRYYAIVQLALVSVNRILLPYIQSEQGHSRIIAVFSEHIQTAKYFGVLIGIGVVVSPCLIPIIDGGRYPGSIPVFQVLSVSSFISFLLSPYINVLFKEKEYKFLLTLAFCVLPCHVIGNIFMQHFVGSLGVACMNLLTYSFFNWAVYKKADVRLSQSARDI